MLSSSLSWWWPRVGGPDVLLDVDAGSAQDTWRDGNVLGPGATLCDRKTFDVSSQHETESVRRGVDRIYDRLASRYDLFAEPMERMGGSQARDRLMKRAHGQVLEVGVGTGTNLEHYPSHVRITGVDLSPRMLERARVRAEALGLPAELITADIEQLPFPDASFDTVTATCVFCSVGDPVQGLREVGRVLRPGGQVLLYEHVRPRGRVLGAIFDLLTPLTRRVIGPSINRRTEQNVTAAGLALLEVRRAGIWREMVATGSPGAG